MTGKELADKLEPKLKAAFDAVLAGGKDAELPPAWKANMKKLFAGEMSETEEHRTLFKMSAFQYLTHVANLNADAVRSSRNATGFDHLMNTYSANTYGLWVDRTANPDEVAQLTETLRKGTAPQIDAIVSSMAASIAAELLKNLDIT